MSLCASVTTSASCCNLSGTGGLRKDSQRSQFSAAALRRARRSSELVDTLPILSCTATDLDRGGHHVLTLNRPDLHRLHLVDRDQHTATEAAAVVSGLLRDHPATGFPRLAGLVCHEHHALGSGLQSGDLHLNPAPSSSWLHCGRHRRTGGTVGRSDLLVAGCGLVGLPNGLPPDQYAATERPGYYDDRCGEQQPWCALLTDRRGLTHLSERPLQQEVAILGRTVQERLRWYLTEELLHLLQFGEFGTALRTRGQVLIELTGLVRLKRSKSVGAELRAFVLTHRATSASCPAITARR